MNANDYYLKSSEKVHLVEKLGDDRFLVEKYMLFVNYDGDTYEDLSGQQIVVDQIFKTVQPIYDLDIEFKKEKLVELDKEINEKRKEFNEVRKELAVSEKKRNDLSKLIIDRSKFITSKDIVVFTKDRVMPTRRNGSVRGLKMTIEINLITGEERRWAYKIYDDNQSSSEYVDRYSDILFDPSEEEVIEIIKSRTKSGNFSAYQISQVDDAYLDEEQINIKYSDILERQMQEYTKTESEIARQKEKLETLTLKMSENIKWKSQEV
jgi:predicted transcriptional regulator